MLLPEYVICERPLNVDSTFANIVKVTALLNINFDILCQLHRQHPDQLWLGSLGEEDSDGELQVPSRGDLSCTNTGVSRHLETVAK